MRVSATEAKNRFGSLLALAKREPVFVEKAGQLDTVILSAEHYHALLANHDKASRAARKKRFEVEFGDWITAQTRALKREVFLGLRRWIDHVAAQGSALVSAMDAVLSVI